VREDLAAQIREPLLQGNVLIGYHNGAELSTLVDAGQPPEDAALGAALKPAWDLLANDPRTRDFATLRPSAGQITARPRDGVEDMIWPVVRHYAAICGLSAVRSTHSIDLLAPGVGKRRLVEAVRARLLTVGRLLSSAQSPELVQ
jgi:hypothetical protein